MKQATLSPETLKPIKTFRKAAAPQLEQQFTAIR
jgi:hypothetical protein